jgi:hypothetical protein
MSSQTVKLGTQTITPKVEDMGNSYYIEFQVKITKYLNNPVNQTIDVKFICNKQVVVPSANPLSPPTVQTVQKTIQECVDEWYNMHKSVYEVA